MILNPCQRRAFERVLDWGNDYARICSTTRPPTSVSRNCLPWKRNVSFWWSMPSKCRIVACKVVYVHTAVDDVEPVIVRLAVYVPSLDPAARHPQREYPAMMIPPVVIRLGRALRVWRPAELPAPDHQRFVKHPALFQIADQPGGRLVDVPRHRRELLRQPSVMVPPAMIELDEAYVSLRQPSRQQAIRREGARLPRVLPVQRQHMLGLLRCVRQVGNTSLHAERHLVLRDSRFDFRIAGATLQTPVQFRQRVQLSPSLFPGQPRRVRQVEHRVAGCRNCTP